VLQSVAGGGALLGDTNKDVGLILQYHTGSANKTAFLGYDDSAGKLTFIPDASISSEVTSGTVGTMVVDIEGDVTGAVTGNADTATALATGRTIGMTGDVVWTSASFDGSGNVTGSATIQANSVAMGTDTTGNYVATVTAGTGLTSTGATSGESIAHSLSVDASQTQITSVGTIGTGTWEGTTVAVAQGGTGVTSSTGSTNVVLSNSPTLVTPALGTPASGVATNLTGTASGLTAGTVTTNANLTGDVTSSGNATSIASDVIVNADVKSDAAIVMSKTALVGGTGLTLSTNTLNVDAAQTQITSVGTIGTGTWQGTAVADGYIASASAWNAKENVGVATAMAIALG